MDNRVFFYVDGIPTKGCWIDLTEFHDSDDIAQELADKGFIPKDEDGEPDYGGDILAADAEGVMRHFIGTCDFFDLDGATSLLAYEGQYDDDVIEAAVELFGTKDFAEHLDDYIGHFENQTDLAYHFVEECGDLSDMPERLQAYFDYEKYGRDLAMDFMESDGHYFHSR